MSCYDFKYHRYALLQFPPCLLVPRPLITLNDLGDIQNHKHSTDHFKISFKTASLTCNIQQSRIINKNEQRGLGRLKLAQR